jgi:FG-GAP-like repeat
MRPTHKRYVYLAVVALFTVMLSDPAPLAQSAPLLPSVDLRRDLRLHSEVWPGDFNGDGITDLVASQSSAGMHVVLGRGDGSFGNPIANPFVGRVIQVADFNGDRRVDVVVAGDPPANGVAILPSNGNGTFAAPRQVETEFGSFAITGDFTGDGRRDLVVGGWPEVRVFPGNGDFTFGIPARFPYDGFGPASDCLGVFLPPQPCGGGVAADFDNDRDLDFVVAGEFTVIQVFLNQGGLMFAAQPITLGFQPTDVTTGDVDADGKLDLVAAVTSPENGYFSNGSVDVLKGNGDGTFASAVRYRTGNGPFQIVVGDFTHDGQLDIATANRSYVYWPGCGPFLQSSDSVTILPGNRGVFGSPTTFALHDQSEPVLNDGDRRFRDTVLSLNTSDLDRDRFPDLIASQGALLLTRAPAANRPPVANAGPDRVIENSSFVELIGTAIDPDNHLLDFIWRGPGISVGVVHPSTWCFEGAADLGANTYTLTVDDGNGGRDDDTVVITLKDTTVAPEVEVLRPTEGEILTAGEPYTIRWTASDDVGIARFDIRAFIDVGPNGREIPITECTNLPASATECTWQNPPATEAAVVIVNALDTDGNTGSDVTGQFFIRGTGPPNSLPAGWTSRDIGAVGAAGSSAFSAGRFTIRGSGADIWGTADEFQYAYLAIQGDGEITARVDNVQNLHRWVKAGLMIRESTSPGARHVSLFATPRTEKGVAFQRRTAAGGASVHTAGPAIVAPLWLRLTRVGDVFRAHYRKNITDAWTFIAQETLPDFAPLAYLGLAVSSHVDGTVAQATFSSVRAGQIFPWHVQRVGTTEGDATFDFTRFSVDGAGADIWGTSDSFTGLRNIFARPTETFTARVLSVENTHVWAKAGVMMREDFVPESRHVMVIVSPGKGVAMQWRAEPGQPSMSTTPRPGAAPTWVRLIRQDNNYTGQMSTDGVTWITLGTVQVTMSLTTRTLIVTSHNPAVLATAVFDDVSAQ